MKAIILTTLIAAIALLSSCASRVEQATISKLDPAQYAGVWHEIGRLPNRFEKDLLAATATYRLLPDGKLSVKNEGLKSNGKRTQIEGRVTQDNPQRPGQLKVRFNPFPANLFAGDYWILALNQDYTRAMVGSPNQKYLWFLSKRPDATKENFTDFLETAQKLGYETSPIYWNPKRISQ